IRRSLPEPELRVELPGPVERDKFVAAADMLAVDKDLRDAGAAAGAADHLIPPARLFHQVDLDELHSLALEQRARPGAIGTPHRAVHLNLGHLAALSRAKHAGVARRYGAAAGSWQTRASARSPAHP